MRYDNNKIVQASVFAEAAHAAVGQLRKYTGEPYVVHPRAVAQIVLASMVKDLSSEIDSNVVAAALLHDVIEDTGVTEALVRERFGNDVADLVMWVTDTEQGNREFRRAATVERLSRAPARAQLIKVADLIDNTKSIVPHDPKFAKTYLREKALVLDVLLLAPAALVAQARQQVSDGWAELTNLELIRETA